MKKIILLPALLLFTYCNTPPPDKKMQRPDQNAGFERYRGNFVEALWRVYPGWASGVGYHNYDSVLIIPDRSQRNKELAFDIANLDSLKAFAPSALSDQNKIDLYMMRDFLNGGIWSINDLKSYEWDPSAYNVGSGFAEMLANNYDSLDNRLRSFHLKMKNISDYYKAAKENVKNPTVEHTELAISQNLGSISIFESELQDALKRSHLSTTEKESMQVRARQAVLAIRDYADWLKAYKNKEPRSFRLGKALYLRKFEFDIQSGYSAPQIYQKAMSHKRELHEKMFAITMQLWPVYLKNKSMPVDTLLAIKQLIDVLSLQHTKPGDFQNAITLQIPKLVAFIRKKDLIYIDPSKPLVVRKEPAYMAGLAGASISSPGPYDKNGNTYYNVGSLSGWDGQRAESYLREYNDYILQILNIHEAIPGHYTQLIYSNRSPDLIKSVLSNGAMVEGWAVYTERMMLENGYGAAAGATHATPEMWLMYYKWNLRSTCNTLLDYGVHVSGMSKEEAMHLLVTEAFQQQAEAEGKWHRVSISQVQLCSYFTGYTEIYDFREELRKKMGASFNLKTFHEKFLSYGSPPVKYIRELMLENF